MIIVPVIRKKKEVKPYKNPNKRDTKSSQEEKDLPKTKHILKYWPSDR